MASNPLKIRFDSDNLEALELELARTKRPITNIVNQAVRARYTDISANTLLGALSLPGIIRLESATAAAADIEHVCALLSRSQLRRIVFAAKDDRLNDRCMVAYFEMDEVIILADQTTINHARRPREREVQELFIRWDELNLSNITYFVPEIAPDTSGKSIDEAWRMLCKLPVKTFDLSSYLLLLSPPPGIEE